MRLKDKLFAIEDYFRAHLDEDCLIAFPQMAGTCSRDEVAASANDPSRWKGLKTEGKGFIHPIEDLAMLD